MAKAGVGFASSVNQTKAASAKKSRKVEAVPTTPAMRLSVAKIRAQAIARQAAQQTAITSDHAALRLCYLEVVEEMRLARRDARARLVQQPIAVKPPVVFETFVQVVEEAESAPTLKPAPLPERVVIIDIAPLLLPALASPDKQYQRTMRRINKMYWQDRIRKTGNVIELPAYFGGDFAAEAEARRARIRQAWTWQRYDSGEMEIKDFCPELPPAEKPQPTQMRGVKGYGFHHRAGFRSTSGF